jgi:alpha-mannosidase
MVQFGDFHFGDFQREFQLERALLLGWVTNNYWETNFRAHQPGQVSSRYRMMPYAGDFDESRAHRFGIESMHHTPVFQHLGELIVSDDLLPESGSLLTLPELPIAVLHIKASDDEKGIIARLLNASDSSQQVTVQSGLLKITGAKLCDLLERPTDTINVSDGEVVVDIEPRRIAVLHLQVE